MNKPIPSVPRSTHAGPLIAFFFLALIWGYNWVVVKVAMDYAGPLDFAAMRCVLGAALLFGVLALLRVPLKPRHVGKTLWLGFFQTGAFVGLISWSLTSGAAGKTAVLAYTMPFWVLLIGWPFLDERLRGWQWAAVGLALAGLVLVLELWQDSGDLTSSLLALAAGASWAVSVIIFKRIPVNGRDELLTLTAWQMLFGAVPLVIASLLVPERSIAWTLPFVASLVFNIVGAMAIATLLWQYILYSLPATVSGMSSLIIPVVGVLSAWVQLGERPSGAESLGMMLILAGIALLTTRQRATTPPG
jgi:drug/metabolite transporter (DMT)-like permease